MVSEVIFWRFPIFGFLSLFTIFRSLKMHFSLVSSLERSFFASEIALLRQNGQEIIRKNFNFLAFFWLRNKPIHQITIIKA